MYIHIKTSIFYVNASVHTTKNEWLSIKIYGRAPRYNPKMNNCLSNVLVDPLDI